MTKQLGTLWLIGFMAAAVAPAAGCIETVHGHDHGGGGAACGDYQYFSVQWGIDHGPGTAPLTCADIRQMASHVELTTGPSPATLIPSYNIYCHDGDYCPDGSPCNMSADTADGLPAGTYVTAATLVGPDGSQLSSSPGQGPAYGITACDGVVLPYIFTIQ